MKKYIFGQDTATIEEVNAIIKDWQSQDCKFVYQMTGRADRKGSTVWSLVTYGTLPEEMEKFAEAEQEAWEGTKELQWMKARWDIEFSSQPDRREVCRICSCKSDVLMAVMARLDELQILHGEVLRDHQSKEWYVNVPNDGGAHYLEELINMGCAEFAIEKFHIKEFVYE